MIYLDHAATTPVYPEVVECMQPYMKEKFFNPSGSYEGGYRIHKELEKIRRFLAESIHAVPEEIIFTSGGTESDNWVLVNATKCLQKKGRHIITSSIEHHAILHTCQSLEQKGYEVTYLPVDHKGLIDPEQLEQAIRTDTILISIMYANNEIGTIQPIKECGRIARNHGIAFHSDAVQAYCHIPIDVNEDNLDFMSVSAHKFGGPKGVGFFYARNECPLQSFLYGGAQEHGKRAGTENVAGIIGMGKAAELSLKNLNEHRNQEMQLRELLKKKLLSGIDRARLNGDAVKRLPGNLNISFRDIEGQSLIAMLEMKGIYVSGGSACTSADKSPSHVLKAIGLSDEMARGAIRISLGYENTTGEMEEVCQAIAESVRQLRDC